MCYTRTPQQTNKQTHNLHTHHLLFISYGSLITIYFLSYTFTFWNVYVLTHFFSSCENIHPSTQNIHTQNFKIHKLVGTYGKYLVPVHAGAAVGHYFTNAPKIFSRINPFRGAPRH